MATISNKNISYTFFLKIKSAVFAVVKSPPQSQHFFFIYCVTKSFKVQTEFAMCFDFVFWQVCSSSDGLKFNWGCVQLYDLSYVEVRSLTNLAFHLQFWVFVMFVVVLKMHWKKMEFVLFFNFSEDSQHLFAVLPQGCTSRIVISLRLEGLSSLYI